MYEFIVFIANAHAKLPNHPVTKTNNNGTSAEVELYQMEPKHALFVLVPRATVSLTVTLCNAIANTTAVKGYENMSLIILFKQLYHLFYMDRKGNQLYRRAHY